MYYVIADDIAGTDEEPNRLAGTDKEPNRLAHYFSTVGGSNRLANCVTDEGPNQESNFYSYQISYLRNYNASNRRNYNATTT
jgi:hypothetical protein